MCKKAKGDGVSQLVGYFLVLLRFAEAHADGFCNKY